MTYRDHGKKLIGPLMALSFVLGASSIPVHASHPAASPPPLIIADGQPPMALNFNPFSPTKLDFQVAYEPLYIVSFVGGKTFPWLATGYAWSKDVKTLTFTLRSGVKWSDGQPMTAKDVYYTFTAGKKVPQMDTVGLWGPSGLASDVTMSGNTVSIHFKQANVAVFANLVNNVMIVPEHIWSKVTNPTTWTNPAPVGTGPFTEVASHDTQSILINKNPYYWQPLKVQSIRIVGYTGNDPLNFDVEAGKIDWTGSFIPHADQLCDAKGTGCKHYFSSHFAPVAFYFNDTKYPFSLVAFRQAVSMAMNRRAQTVSAEYGYQPPADAAGLNGQWPDWEVAHLADTLSTYNPAGAKDLLLKNGFTYKGSTLLDPKGNPVSFTISVVTGWTDWIASCQIIANNLKAIGMDVTVKTLQFGDYLGNHLSVGNFDAAMSWTVHQALPYDLYDGWMGSENFVPVGQPQKGGATNFERFTDPAMDNLLAQFRSTIDVGKQKQLVGEMERIFLNDMPVIPTTINALWYEYNTTRYTGFPTPSDPYVAGSEYMSPDRLVVLSRLHPVGQ